jgi:hypothetical protein
LLGVLPNITTISLNESVPNYLRRIDVSAPS